ncbi:hypothetical protein Salmuc_01829 [Salipiger mucosus DSM 16094]|uniref:AB hydrolase-1 domain-containing protein n=2 Tax=Salipiger mucosus TaxID=263378 RepID=S9SCV0_9RHOB|nr:hypothetical protein Salmuc_01829 [Salipiger mucosus DSM 16094]
MRIWERRMQDCLDARDSHDRIGKTINIEIDASYPIFMGHSFGAMTGLLLSGARVGTLGGLAAGQDTDWAGRILLSPPGNGVFGLTQKSWASLSSPTLTITNAQDQGIIHQPPTAKLDSYFQSPEGYRHLGYLEGGGPSIYSGQRARPKTKEYFLFFDLRGAVGAFVAAYGTRDTEAFQGLYDGSIEDRSYRLIAIRSR